MAMEQLKIKAGESAGVLFKRDDVRYDVHSTYGKSWCYIVSVNAIGGTVDMSLRAKHGLQNALIKASVSKNMGAVIALPAKGDGKGVVWKIDVHDEGDGNPIVVKDWDGLILDRQI